MTDYWTARLEALRAKRRERLRKLAYQVELIEGQQAQDPGYKAEMLEAIVQDELIRLEIECGETIDDIAESGGTWA
ncbi:MAG: hypothetical protein WCB12_22610 [Bryobacteraceae bacterium]